MEEILKKLEIRSLTPEAIEYLLTQNYIEEELTEILNRVNSLVSLDENFIDKYHFVELIKYNQKVIFYDENIEKYDEFKLPSEEKIQKFSDLYPNFIKSDDNPYLSEDLEVEDFTIKQVLARNDYYHAYYYSMLGKKSDDTYFYFNTNDRCEYRFITFKTSASLEELLNLKYIDFIQITGYTYDFSDIYLQNEYHNYLIQNKLLEHDKDYFRVSLTAEDILTILKKSISYQAIKFIMRNISYQNDKVLRYFLKTVTTESSEIIKEVNCKKVLETYGIEYFKQILSFSLFINLTSRRQVYIEVKSSDTINKIKLKITSETGIPFDKQILTNEQKINLEDNKTLKDYGIVYSDGYRSIILQLKIKN